MKKPIHLVIDTNILKSKPHYKEEYKALQRLIEKNIIILYLHYIVKEEYRTQIEKPYLESLKHIQENLNKLVNMYHSNKETIESILCSVNNLKNDITTKIKDDIQDNFDNKLQARYLDIQPNDVNAVFERYFAGFPPFKIQKDRKNIPDAFIFVSLLKMVNENKNIVFITNDNNFTESVKDINDNNSNKIDTFKSIDEFLQTKEIEEILVTKDSQEKIKEFIETIQSKHIIEYIFSDDLDNPFRLYEKIEKLHKINNKYIPSIDNTATITHIAEIYDDTIQADFEKITYYSNDTIGIPITFRVEVESQLIVSRNIINDIMSQWGGIVAETRDEHYCDVEKNIELEINATLIIVVSDNTNDINSMNIDMEINNAKFIDFAY